jgi:hypothetical protein
MARDRFRLVEDDDGLFVERNGKRIAKRGVGRYAKQWISLEPGVVAYGDVDLGQRFLGLNHIRLLRRVYMTKCG